MEGVRPASADDIPRIAELVASAIEELRPMKGGEIWAAHEASVPPHEARLARVVDDPGVCLLVGTIDDVVVGYMFGRTADLSDGRRLGVIDDIFVEEAARGVSVGEAMIAAALRWFSEAGCIGVDTIALPGHRVTKNFFEGSGFTARLLVMHHRLGDG